MVFLLLIVGLSPAAAEEPTRIKTIVVEGNSKTTDATVILISAVERGDDFTQEMVAELEQRLRSSGLFKEVHVLYNRKPEGVELILQVKDKHSWAIAPTYYNQPTNKGVGLGFGENNLFGENKKMLVYGQIATGDSFFVGGYIDPALRGTRFRWQLDTYLLWRGRVIEYAAPTGFLSDPKPVRQSTMRYLNVGLRTGINITQQASLDIRVRAAWLSYRDVRLAEGAQLSDVTSDPAVTEVPAPGVQGADTSASVSFDYDTRAHWYGISHGDRYQLSFEHSLPPEVSEFEYWLASARFQRARRYFSRHNLVITAGLAYGHLLPFQQELTTGGTGLRGYKNAQFRGNLRVVGNMEYSVPLPEIKGVSLRLLGFFDTAYTAFVNTEGAEAFRNYLPGHDRLGAAPFKNTVGVGTRLNIRQIVLPLLGLDLGYGLERGDYEIYLAIGLTDL